MKKNNKHTWLTHNAEFRDAVLDFSMKHGYADFDSKKLASDFGDLKCKWWGNGAKVIKVWKNADGKWNVDWK